MIRTQVYLTEEEKSELESIASTHGIKQSELIRRAIDDLIDRWGKERGLAALRGARGVWKDRQDLPDLRDMRQGWSRRSAR